MKRNNVEREVGMKYTKEIINAMRTASYLIEPPASEVIGGLLDEIERLQSENEWIPVSERLPEDKRVAVLCFTPEYNHVGIRLASEIGEAVTHWRPLPQPPESEK